MSLKKSTIANFNTVFMYNDEERPLLEYFDTVLMPALNSKIERIVGDDRYFFMNIDITTDIDLNYILTGLIVKKTTLEVKSNLTTDGTLVNLDSKIPSAPFSTFSINLKNHRMIFVENQKGSPKLSTFRSTIKYIIDRYIREENSKLDANSEFRLPIPLVNVVGIPPRKNIEKELKEVCKINSLILRFYPLNGDGDIDFSKTFEGLSKDLRMAIGSKNGEITYRSPKNINGVIDIISKTEGTVEPIIKVEYQNKSKRTIKNDEMSETMELDINDSNMNEMIQDILLEGQKIDSLNYTSEENERIYEENIGKIIPFKN